MAVAVAHGDVLVEGIHDLEPARLKDIDVADAVEVEVLNVDDLRLYLIEDFPQPGLHFLILVSVPKCAEAVVVDSGEVREPIVGAASQLILRAIGSPLCVIEMDIVPPPLQLLREVVGIVFASRRVRGQEPVDDDEDGHACPLILINPPRLTRKTLLRHFRMATVPPPKGTIGMSLIPGNHRSESHRAIPSCS